MKDAAKSYGLGTGFIMKRIDGGLITRSGKNIIREIRGSTKVVPGLEGMYQILKVEVTTLWEGLLGWRVLARY